jgi:hypothetical protein
MNEEIRNDLLRMAEEDSQVRAELAATGELFQGYAPRMAAVHLRNAQALAAIIERCGWPGRTLAGDDGAQAAFLIVQHAIGSPDLQRRCLPLLQAAATRHEIEPKAVAYLEDRIAFFERRPQRYGTQFDWDEAGKMSPWTLAEPERVEEYRRAVGLEPLAERIQAVRQGDEAAPPDYQSRQQEMIEWAKSVGWL